MASDFSNGVIPKTPLMQKVERRQGGEIPQLLLDLHVRQRKTFDEISKAWGVSRSIVAKWAKDFGVDRGSYAQRAAADEPEPEPQEQPS